MLVPNKKPGRPRTQIDACEDWLRRLLLTGPKTMDQIRRGKTSRGDSWATVRRCKAKLRLINLFYDGRHWWALPEQMGLPQPSTAPVERNVDEAVTDPAEPDVGEREQVTLEKFEQAMTSLAVANMANGCSAAQIAADLRHYAGRDFDIGAGPDEIETRIRRIALAHGNVDDLIAATDPVAFLEGSVNLKLYGTVRTKQVAATAAGRVGEAAGLQQLIDLMKARVRRPRADREEAF
jgi:hypothetical protein